MDKGGDIFCIPAYPVDKIIDTTGAGDSFAGGFMGYIASRAVLTQGGLSLGHGLWGMSIFVYSGRVWFR